MCRRLDWKAMEKILFYLAGVTVTAYVMIAIDLGRGNRRIRSLKDVAPLTQSHWPRVSVIIAARNEARNIEEALQSVLNQDYPQLEIIVADDRSTDRTGDLLDRMAARDRRLRPIHITELPAGWLGKNHALDFAARQATGEFLLFTDADIVMHPTVIRRAISYAEGERRDHLALGPEAHMPGVLLNAFVGVFGFFFLLFTRPWKAADPQSRRFIGIGAFNLMRAAAYRGIGGHQAIRMRPDDDIKLGKLIKQSGYRQELLHGVGMISVEWYSSVRELIDGTEKNFFSGLEYNLAVAIGAALLQLVFFVWPFVAAWVTDGATRWANLAAVFILLASYAMGAHLVGARRRYAVLFPVSVLLFVYLMWNSARKTLMNGGINWRDTHYSLAELKANKV
jgi:cellulose synthase/poly-beta-1,6-N-acetylglucosamine synthase-like glycosyltransferase